MSLAATIFAALVAIEHVYFALLEMVFWTKPLGLKTFGRSLAEQQQSAALAANQGLYNLFLAAGLAWSFFAPSAMVHPIRIFFFGCVVVAGIFGGLTVSMRIAVIQAIPAAIGVTLVLLS